MEITKGSNNGNAGAVAAAHNGKVTTKPILIVQGGQWGSEAKGLVTAKLTNERAVDVAIRTGTVNAGHTVYHRSDRVPYQAEMTIGVADVQDHWSAHKMQQLPVSWVRTETKLVLGPGAFIHPTILAREIKMVEEATGRSLKGRLVIDHRCGIHTDRHTDLAATAGRHYKMGATGKGCSEAVVHKIRSRGAEAPALFVEWLAEHPDHWLNAYGIDSCMGDTVRYVNMAFDRGKQLLIEGTQGTFLDLHIGPYPYTTHKQTQAASWMAEAGLSCTLPTELWLVMRTYPIRVAGNSGPMPGEISWQMLASIINDRLDNYERPPLVERQAIQHWTGAVMAVLGDCYPEAPRRDPGLWTEAERAAHQEAASEVHRLAFERVGERTRAEIGKLFERTTVTNKLRRVACWSGSMAEESVMLNRPHFIALTFMNYMYPEYWGATRPAPASEQYLSFVDRVCKLAPVGMVSFGPLEENCFMTDAAIKEVECE